MSESEQNNPALATPSAAVADAPEQVLFDGRPALINNLLECLWVLLTLGLVLLVYWIKSLSVHYRITTQRIVVEQGLLSKRTEHVDLYRLNDYTVVRSLGQRVMGTGTLILKTMDRTNPELKLDRLKTDVSALYEKVRAATENEKRRRRVGLLDAETHAVS